MTSAALTFYNCIIQCRFQKKITDRIIQSCEQTEKKRVWITEKRERIFKNV